MAYLSKKCPGSCQCESHPSCCPPVLRGSSSIPLYILITWWCFKSTLYLLEITSEKQVCCLSSISRIACVRVSLHIVCNTQSLSSKDRVAPTVKHAPAALCRLTSTVYSAAQSWHRIHRCAKVASVEMPVLSQVLLLIFFLEMQAIYYVYTKE